MKRQTDQHDQQDGGVDLEEQCRQQRDADQDELNRCSKVSATPLVCSMREARWQK